MSDKIYRPIILVLLVALVSLLAIQTVTSLSGPSDDCLSARNNAQTILSLSIPLITEYESAVYDRAENINQQQFMATEFSFMTLQIIARQNESIIELLASCK